ncbi:type VI secretion protein ImpB [Tsuneonella sp. CC-YZS046]|uniref:Y-family DNA polymerase n=1 Tax=Tsuneonella sp. CC-YZS046 TaxID=3042152 RepID=UPI002D77B669|nr:type VI secretion protein ImpB [Tsuneonella sp. CC-YZS046]WRO67019.1 type VI secretion protein ImpB [Tsuneonella sp. CC-YZS046]
MLLAPSPFSPSPLRWLYVDFNSYFASVEQQLRPDLRGRPVAVVPVESDSTCAIAASYEAKAHGIRTGTAIWEAKKLCSDLVCVLARHELYVEYHHRAIEEISRHIPVSDVCSIDEMAARLMRNEAEPAVAREIALAVKAGLKERLGEWVRCSIGIAPNRYLAKVATDLEKPDGLTVLMPEDIERRLTAELAPIDLPGIGRNMKKRLHIRGIHSVADIFALDRRQLRKAWGSIWGERMWYYLRGHDLPELRTQRRSIGHSHVLAPEMRPPARAVDVARRLVLKAAARLRRMGYTASIFGFSARLEDGRRLRLEMRCRPAQDSVTFLAMMLEAWDRLVPREAGVRVRKLSVAFYGLEPEAAFQPDLFAQAEAEAGPWARRLRDARLSRALDRLNHRFGRDTVLIGMLPSAGRGFSGAKIAFTRIPDREEFIE